MDGGDQNAVINAGEASIVAVLKESIATFTGNLSFFVPDIYAQLSASVQQEISTWWSNPSNVNGVVVQDGYNMTPIQGVQFAVITGSEKVVPSRRYVGNFSGLYGLSNQFATTFESTYSIGCMSPNRNQLLWLQMLCKWCLLYNLQTIENSYGLFNAVVTTGPMIPVPDSMKDAVFPFMRTVELTAQHEDTWATPPAVAASSVTVLINDTTA